MTNEEAIEVISQDIPCEHDADLIEALKMAIKALEQEPCEDELDFVQPHKKIPVNIEIKQEPCEDAISKQAIYDELEKWEWQELYLPIHFKENIVDVLPPVTPTQKWIPCSERFPEPFSFVNCTCHSLIDDREDWVVETCYLPQLHNSPYSDWGNIPMLNWGEAEVIAWMYRDIPKPYKAESEMQK